MVSDCMDTARVFGLGNWRAGFKPWLGGVLAACIVLGPALGPGDLLNLDLITTPRLRPPDWRWGVGPGVPHRVPSYVPLAWLSEVIDGATVIKLFYVFALAALFVGVWRLAASGDARIDAGVALFVTWSPFTVTRVAVGHPGVVWAMAAVAWGAPALLRMDAQSSRGARRLCGVAAIGGLIPGTWVLAVGAAGALGGPAAGRRMRIRQWLSLLPLQLAWIVPSALFAILGTRLVGGGKFRPSIGALAPLELLAGLGFWRQPNQVQAAPWWPLIALAVAALAVLGIRTMNARFGRPWMVITTGAIVIPILTVVAPFSTVLNWLTNSAVGTPLREIQRWWGLALVLLSPCIAAGAVVLVERSRSLLPALLPAAAALLLAGNGLWGNNGAMVPVHYPHGWSTAAAAIRRQAGTTLVLPWHQYLDVSFADGRRALHPLAEFLPGDLVFSTDPEFNVIQREVDPRGERAVQALNDPDSASAALAELGIRYVAAARFGDSNEGLDRLARAPGFTPVYNDADIMLLRVDMTSTRWVDWWFGPIGTVATGSAPIAVAGGTGWVLGSTSIASGTAILRPGNRSGLLWYWPALVVLVAYIISVTCWVWALVPGKRRFSDDLTS